MHRSKFNVTSNVEERSCDGIVFASQLEMRYYQEVVKPDAASGKIIHYEMQKPYILQEAFSYHGKTVRSILYIADFYLVYADGSAEVIDTKGYADDVAKLKRKIFWKLYPDVKYTWITYSKTDGGWQPYEYVRQKRSERRKARQKANEINGKKERQKYAQKKGRN